MLDNVDDCFVRGLLVTARDAYDLFQHAFHVLRSSITQS